MLRTLKTTFHGQKTFRLVTGSLSWSETPYFHKGGPLRMGPKLQKNCFLKQQYLGNIFVAKMLSIAFEDLLGLSIAPQVMPHWW